MNKYQYINRNALDERPQLSLSDCGPQERRLVLTWASRALVIGFVLGIAVVLIAASMLAS